MNRWKKLRVVLSLPLWAALLLPLTGVSSAAEELPAEKAFVLLDNAGTSYIEEQPAEPAFWEYPTVPAGQTRLTQGTLILKNNTGLDAVIRLDRVELPYADPESLAYLAALTLTVRDGDTVLYSGPYAAANDGGLNLSVSLSPGATKAYTVSLRCGFAYEGEPAPAGRLYWQFTASATAIENPGEPRPASSPVVVTLFCVAGGLVLVCAVAGGYLALRRSRP